MTESQPQEQERLARVEWKIETGFQGVHGRLDVLNGQVATNSKFRQEHEVQHARADGRSEGQTALRGSAYIWIGLLCSVASVVGGLVAQVAR